MFGSKGAPSGHFQRDAIRIARQSWCLDTVSGLGSPFVFVLYRPWTHSTAAPSCVSPCGPMAASERPICDSVRQLRDTYVSRVNSTLCSWHRRLSIPCVCQTCRFVESFRRARRTHRRRGETGRSAWCSDGPLRSGRADAVLAQALRDGRVRRAETFGELARRREQRVELLQQGLLVGGNGLVERAHRRGG